MHNIDGKKLLIPFIYIFCDKFRKFPIPKKKILFFAYIRYVFLPVDSKICNQNLGDGTRNMFFLSFTFWRERYS